MKIGSVLCDAALMPVFYCKMRLNGWRFNEGRWLKTVTVDAPWLSRAIAKVNDRPWCGNETGTAFLHSHNAERLPSGKWEVTYEIELGVARTGPVYGEANFSKELV